MPVTPPSELRILVGVTGHRDILAASLRDVQNAVQSALVNLRNAFGSSLLLMTALAEGADQLVAEVARGLGIPMIAISPMPLQRYRGTMETQAGAEALDRLWNDGLVVQRVELPLVVGCDPAQQDATQYEQLGLLLSRQSHILLALWNGYDPEPCNSRTGTTRQIRGGCPHVVAMRQNGEHSEVALQTISNSVLFSGKPPQLELARSGPILHVVTPRQLDNGAKCQDAGGRPHLPGSFLFWSDLPPRRGVRPWRRLLEAVWPNKPEKARQTLVPQWHALTADSLQDHIPEVFQHIHETGVFLARRRTTTEVANTAKPGLCPEKDLLLERDTAALRRLRQLFTLADGDASNNQRHLFGTWLTDPPWRKRGRPRIGMLIWFALAVPFATVCFEIFKDYGRSPIWLALYLASIVAPFSFYLFVANRYQWQRRYEDHRALAEGLRVQFFWAASGISVAVSDNYLRHQTGELGWIRLALRGAALDGLAAALAVQAPDPPFLREWWIDHQIAYFKRQGELQESANVTMRRLTRLTVFALLFLAVVLFILQLLSGAHSQSSWSELVAGVLSVALGALPSIISSFVIIAEGRAFEEHARSYTQTRDVFAEARRQSEALGPANNPGWRELLIALGQEALTENAAWFHTHRGRPVASKVG